MANAVTTGCLLSLMALYFLSNFVVSSSAVGGGGGGGGGSQGDSWTRRRRFSVLAHHQRLAGSDEGREADYDGSSSLLQRRKRDSTINGGSDAKFNGEGGGGNGVKWVDNTGELNNAEFPKENEDHAAQQQQQQQQQQQRSLMSNEEEVSAAKRKWSDKNVRIWGKRKWSSKGLHLWGKRQQEDGLDEEPTDAADQPMGEFRGKENDVRDWPNWEWQNNKVSNWEKNAKEETKKRQKWAKNNLKMWGKRHAETEELSTADDMERAAARMRAAMGSAGTEELSDGLQGTSHYGNRISGYLQKRSNPLSNGVEQKWGKKGWANNNVRIWG